MKVLKPEYLLLPSGDFRNDYVLVCPPGSPPYPALQSSVSPEIPTEQLKGYLIPGLVNVHTHLELSTYRDCIPQKTGLAGFVSRLQSLRQNPPENESQAVMASLSEMELDGIVAVGDIDNAGKWMAEKESSMLLFHHFFERLGLSSSSAYSRIQNAVDLAKSFNPSIWDRISITPHAPYSCSKALVNACFKMEFNRKKPLSVHMLESREELIFMHSASGPLADMIRSFGIPLSAADVESDDSLKHILPEHKHSAPLIFVHNTLLNKPAQLDLLRPYKEDIFLCLCLRANHYIEGLLPDVEQLFREGFNLCLGTDSLASNSSLRITDEMNFLKMNFPNIPDMDIIRWASTVGIRALNLSYDKIQPEHLWHHLSLTAGKFSIKKAG